MSPTQINRPFRLKTVLGDDALLLESFQGQERISAPFRYLLRVLTDDANVDMKSLLKSALVLTIVLEGSERHIHGNVRRIKLLSNGSDGLAAYEIEMVPSFWFLNLFSDCRIFQNKTVPQIVEKVFQDRGITNYRLDVSGSCPELEYCVQYRETDFNFVSRLLEQEGIYYYFEQTDDDHTIVLVDQKEALVVCKHDARVSFAPFTGGNADEDTIFSLESEAQVYSGTASLRDYDFVKPAVDLSASLSNSMEGEVYDYPGDYLTKDDGDRYSRIRLEEQELRSSIIRAESNCLGLECGYKFTLEDHLREDANQEYLITSLWQSGKNSSYSAKSDPTAFEYHNRLEAIPSSVSFRPPRLARKPVIEGVQTAVVVGKSGEEIWTDEYGRVKVQFFWDREGSCDDKSSCWIRVSQGWAGKQWGAICIPRIGQEVIITFLEGDPDRPIVTGRVYNADQMPPYPLPDEQTKSTVKSMSSKGQAGFNEFRFEDKTGSEEVFLHAEKDLDIRVKNDRKEFIGNNHNLEVTADKNEKISGDESSEVVGKRAEKIGGNHYLAISGNQGIKISGDHSLTVSGNVVETVSGAYSNVASQAVYIKGQMVVIEADSGLTLKVGGNFVTIDASGVSVQGTMVLINSGGAALSGSPGSPVSLQDPTKPDPAVDATPGGVTSAPSADIVSPRSISLSRISPAQRTQDDD